MTEIELLTKVINSLSCIPVAGREACGRMYEAISDLDNLRSVHIANQRNQEADKPEETPEQE